MTTAGYFIIAVAVLAAAAVVVWDRRQARRLLKRLDAMLEKAITQGYTEEDYDESLLSAVEARLARYLASSTVSARNLQAEKDKIKTLIADISHQTKTPISNLLLYSELLKEENLPEAAAYNVNALHQQTEKLRFLIDALVKLSRLENGIITLAPQTGKIQPMLEDIREQFAPEAAEKGLYLYLENTAATAEFDRKWTAEALCNIVDNAVKYTARGGISISVHTYEMFARIDIADTGTGVPEEEQSRIFSRFYRSPSVKEQEGVGIGLYLAREIITGQGGYIKVSSQKEKGSVFSVFLPI